MAASCWWSIPSRAATSARGRRSGAPRWASTAAVVNAFGKGRVFTCGGNLSIAVRDTLVANREPALPRLYALALEAAGLSAETTPLWTLERSSQKNAFRFLFNPTGEPQTAEIPSGFQVRYASAEAKGDGNRLALAPNAAVVLVKSV